MCAMCGCNSEDFMGMPLKDPNTMSLESEKENM